ncbi:hypothetical protein [Spirulina sp. 06S082]|uniref:hypothetical protein n=1 Tax=Spirulina sp. 06S082 TaxID=3110248 RepID=UPI002B1FE699|nr:hypothetical protein [Spirulina sp. 06S082]MEA5471742.1 hypothetical protein [Spirulina sp. 06S082]
MSDPSSVKLDTIARLLRSLLRLPSVWLKPMLLLAFLSLFEIGWTGENGFIFNFGVQGTTVLILTAIWIPAGIKLFALVGGRIDTPSGVFSSRGIEGILQTVTPETCDEALGALKVVLEDAEETAPYRQRGQLREIREQLTEEYGDRVSPERARQDLAKLADRYQTLQEEYPSGTRRNFLFEAVAGGMRALVSSANLSESEILAHLQSQHQGQRLVGLSCLAKMQATEAYFSAVLAAIASPDSAFEQMNALRVVEAMLPHLPPQQKQRLKRAIEQQRDYDESKYQWIKRGSERWMICDRLLPELNKPSFSSSPES